MLHALVPALRPDERLPAEPAAAAQRRLALLMPAARADVVEALLEVVLLGLGRIALVAHPRRVHAALVLGEEVLAVEVVGDAAVGTGVEAASAGFRPGAGRVAAAPVAAVEAELEVLRRDVPLPFVLGREGGGAAVVGEAADEGPGWRLALVGGGSGGGFGA